MVDGRREVLGGVCSPESRFSDDGQTLPFPKELPRHTCANASRRQKSVRGWVIRDDTPRQRKVMGISFINKPEKQPYADKRMP
jgi:hypothetical protein